MDIYGSKVQLRYKGKTTFTSTTGGVLSILSFLLFGTCMYFKVIEFLGQNDGISSSSEIRTRLLEEDTNSEQSELKKSMNLFDHGIKSIELTMNQADDKDKIESL